MTPNPEKIGIYSRFKLLALPVKIVCWTALVGLTFSVLGFLVVPPVAKMVLEKKLPTLLHRPVSIGKIAFNPFSLKVVVENFRVGQKEGPGDLVAFDRLLVNLEAASIFKRALLIKAITLSGPRVEFSRINEQTYSFSDLLTEDPAKKSPPPEPTKPFQFAIRNIEIQGGRIIFHDLPKKTDHSVTDLNLGVPALSNLPYQVETYIQPSFSAKINGTPFALGGQSKPFAKSHETVVELKAKGINIPEYLAYIPNPTGLVLKSALLDVDANLHLLARADNTYRLAVIGRVGLRDLAITDKAGQTYLQFPELAVTLADANLLAKEVHLTEVNLTSPAVNLERLADGRLLPVALLSPADQAPKEPAAVSGDNAKKSGPETGSALKIDIDKILLTDGRVDFLDAAAGAKVATRLDIDTALHLQGQPDLSRLAVIGRLVLSDLAMTDQGGKTYLKIPELALTLADSNLLANEVHLSEINFQAPSVSLEQLTDGRLLPVALLVPPAKPSPGGRASKTIPDNAGQAGPEPGNPLKLEIDKVLLTDGRVDFLNVATGAKVSTRLDIDTGLRFLAAQAENPARLAVIGRVVLRNLALADQAGKNYLKLPELALTLAEANLLANELHFSEINLKSPTVNLERLADGRLLPMALLLPADKPPPAGVTKTTQDHPATPAKGGGDPLKLVIDRIALDNGRVDFLDLKVAASEAPAHLTLRDLTIRVAALSNSPEALANLSLAGKLNEAGRLQVKGKVGLEPVQTRLNLQLTDLALKPFQPYISEQARLVVAGGNLTVTGDLALRAPKDGPLKSDFQGEAAIADLATVDTALGEDLVKWRRLEVKKINFSSDPGQLSIGAINLVGPYINVLLGQDGVLNLTTIRPAKAATAPAPAPEATPPAPEVAEAKPFATNIGSISVSEGRLDFQDRQVDPAYGTSLSELSGSVSDLSSMEESSAEVFFSAKLDQQAPMKITGRINPLRKDLFVDLKVDFTDINMSPVSPYSGKFIGYKIDKGKLNLDLKYDIANRKLHSQNKVFLDQFTLGETVESPDASNLPVRLALALLRDRKGGINLDLPVEGSLDDPDFRIGRVVLQVLINLISKAATSPLALLGALIPEGQDIQFIAFEPGRAELIPESAAKMTTVEKILFDRPELRMDLIGKVEPVADRAALARQHLTNSVKLQKLLAGGKAGKDSEAQVAGVALTEAEYPAFLTAAYKAALKKEKSRKPLEGKPTVAAMETFLLEGIKVSEDELRLLALERANQVLAALTAGGQVEPGRLFVVEPKLAAAGEAAAAQVELVIK